MAEDKKAAEEAADKPAAKKAPAKKPAAKKPAASKATAEKKPAAKKPAASKATAEKKPAAKKAPAKSAATKDEATSASAASKPAAKATGEKATAAKKPAAKKSTGTKAAADKAQPEAKVSTLKVHHLRPADGAHTKKTRVGRGEASKGKTAGRGTKGTRARYQVPERFEGGQTPIHMRIPKLPGFKNPFKTSYQVVNVGDIAELFPKGGKVSKADLVDKGAVRKNQLVKVLGDGDISVKVEIVDADKVSQSAKTKIEAAGGSVNEG